MRGISWVAQDILASQEGLCSMELVRMLVIKCTIFKPCQSKADSLGACGLSYGLSLSRRQVITMTTLCGTRHIYCLGSSFSHPLQVGSTKFTTLLYSLTVKHCSFMCWIHAHNYFLYCTSNYTPDDGLIYRPKHVAPWRGQAIKWIYSVCRQLLIENSIEITHGHESIQVLLCRCH
jgi:hypothetical protein